jgi:hypothetical protein
MIKALGKVILVSSFSFDLPKRRSLRTDHIFMP